MKDQQGNVLIDRTRGKKNECTLELDVTVNNLPAVAFFPKQVKQMSISDDFELAEENKEPAEEDISDGSESTEDSISDESDDSESSKK